VHHDAIETVYDLALGFWHRTKEDGTEVDVSVALSYAMQILCADSAAHRLATHPEIWAGDNTGLFRDSLPDPAPWAWRPTPQVDGCEVRPAIVHLPFSRELLAAAV
jgi:hypothetical protein